MNKIYYRCTICQDIHFGNSYPKICPTCIQENVYVEIDESEAQFVMKNE